MTVRVDTWLWAVRAFKTRSAARIACAEGRVTVNERTVKPAARIGPGDVVKARRSDRTIVHVVVEPISKRVGAARAAECLQDLSPPQQRPTPALVFGRRDAGSGRPTKRDRREIDRFRRRSSGP